MSLTEFLAVNLKSVPEEHKTAFSALLTIEDAEAFLANLAKKG